MRDTVGAQAPAVFFFEGAERSVSISGPDRTEAAGPDTRPVALVLGAAVWPGGRPSPTLRRRTWSVGKGTRVELSYNNSTHALGREHRA